MAKILSERGIIETPDNIPIERMDVNSYKTVHKTVQPRESEPKKSIPIMTPEEKKKEIMTFNNDPEVRANGLLLLKKKSFVSIIVLFSLFILILAVGMIWFNVSVGKIADKSFGDAPITVEGTTNQFNNTVLNEHEINNYINVTVHMPDSMIVNLNSTSV